MASDKFVAPTLCPSPPSTPNPDDDSPISPTERAAAASRSTWVSVVVKCAASTAQIVVGCFPSRRLIADGIHSLSDLVSDFVVLLANRHSQKDADEDHPYGHQRFETARRWRWA